MNLFQKITRKLTIEKHALQVLHRLKSQHTTATSEGPPVLAYPHMDFPGVIPDQNQMISGGGVKYQYLQERFPADVNRCNVVYVVSSSRYHHTFDLLKAYKAKGVKIVWNQNGSFFPHFYGEKMAEKMNQRMFRDMQLADYVFFQSEFAKAGTEQLMGTFDGPSEILYNCIDTNRFMPRMQTASPITPVNILMAGSHNDPYRLRLGVETLSALHQLGYSEFQLLIAGNVLPNIKNEVSQTIEALKLRMAVQFLGPYTQRDSVSVYQQGDLLLHTKFMDVCPSMVLEAMACGLPVVYSKTGGTPELVGEEAGIGIVTKQSFHQANLPAAEDLAKAILNVCDNYSTFSTAARNQVESTFDLRYWMERHEKLFCEILV